MKQFKYADIRPEKKISGSHIGERFDGRCSIDTCMTHACMRMNHWASNNRAGLTKIRCFEH